MNDKLFSTFSLGDLPLKKFDNVCKKIQLYSTVLIRNDDIAGSGTWVKCGNKYGILTAHHVAFQCNPHFNFKIESDDQLGFSVITEIPHNFSIKMKYLIPHEIAIPKNDEWGPDLLFIEIPDSIPQFQTIRAKKNFWNLSQSATENLEQCLDDNNCVWIIAGYPYEFKKEQSASHGFSRVSGIYPDIGLTGVENRPLIGNYDYCDVYLDYTTSGQIPQSCAGMSGGGLWRIPVQMTKGSTAVEDIIVGDPVFAGVLFYQGPITRNRRMIRSHGPQSIYRTAVNVLK